jgi:hypothetical protein
MGIDHGRHRVGGIVEPIDELETERNQQRHHQQQIRQIARDLGAGGVDIGINAVGHEQKPGGDDPKKDDHRQRVETLIEIGP